MTTTQLLAGLCVLASATLYFFAVRSARRRVWSARVLVVLSAVSGIALIAMVLTDWPGELLARFWADHSIFATVVSSLLLISVGYLAFEAGESAEQAKLNRSVTSAGLSGMVDHLIDVDIAQSMITCRHVPNEFEAEGKPLRWIRPIREELQRGSYQAADDEQSPSSEQIEPAAWRHDIVDQSVRRIIAGMRDWAALVAVSGDGRLVLKRFGEVRLALLQLQSELGSRNGGWQDTLHRLRAHLQLFAVGLERVSSPRHRRQGLTNLIPGPFSAKEIDTNIREIDAMAPPNVSQLVSLLDKLVPLAP